MARCPVLIENACQATTSANGTGTRSVSVRTSTAPAAVMRSSIPASVANGLTWSVALGSSIPGGSHGLNNALISSDTG